MLEICNDFCLLVGEEAIFFDRWLDNLDSHCIDVTYVAQTSCGKYDSAFVKQFEILT